MSYQGPSTFGLTQSHLIASQNGVDPYKPAKFLDDSQWWGNKAQAPANTQWSAPSYQNFQYQKFGSGSDPSYKTYGQAAPQYKGMNDGDYDRYELSLRNPGEQAASRAYETAKRDLTDAYSSRGMYGSSQFTRQMDGQVNRSYMDAVSDNAAGAAAKRYDFQAQDQQFAQQQEMAAWQARLQENQAANQMGYNVWSTRMDENQAMNNLLFQNNAASNSWNWQASTAQRDWNDSQAMRQIDYNNMLAQSRQNWDMQGLQWNTAQNDAAWDRTFNIWGRVDPEIEHYEKKLLKQQATAADKKSSGLGSLIGTVGGGLLGGLVGGPVGASFGSSLGGSIGGFAETGDSSSLFGGLTGAVSSQGGQMGLGMPGSLFK